MPRRNRPSQELRGYGVAHRRTVEYWRPLVRAGVVVCPYCGRVIVGRFHLGHSEDRQSYIGPCHPECNVREAGLKTARLREGGGRVVSRTW